MARRPELVWLYSLAGAKVVPLHELADLTVEDRLQDLEALSFTIRAQDPKARYLVADQLCTYAGRVYRVAEIIQERRGARTMIEVYAESRWMDLGKRKRAGVFSLLGRTPVQGLTTILSGTGWTVGTVPADASLFSIEDIDATALSLVRRWAAVTGYEVEFDTVARTVSFVDAIGQDRGIGFRWGLNLLSVERRYEPPRATRLYAYGANNLSIEANNPSGLPYIEDYSWYTDQGLTILQARDLFRKDETWVDERYLLGLNLYDAAVRRLAALAVPTVSYEVSVADLAELTGSTADDVEIGDLVRVRDQGFGIDLETRVVRLIRKPLDPQRNRVELDYLQPGLLDGDRSESTRSIDYGSFNVLVDENSEPISVTSAATEFAAMTLTVTGTSTVVTGATFLGAGVGTGTIRFTMLVGGVPVGPAYDFAFTDGAQVEFSWPSYAADLAEGSVNVVFRGQVVSGTGTVSVANAGDARAWILVRGGVGIGINTSPNQSYQEALLDVEALDELVDAYTVYIAAALDVDAAETLTDPTLDELGESYILPFTIGDPVFGAIGGPGVIPPAL